MSKRRVKIKCLVSNSLCKYTFKIKVYDDNDNLVCDSIGNEIEFMANTYRAYKVMIFSCNNLYISFICKDIVFSSCNSNLVIIDFNNIKEKPHMAFVTLTITDENYKGLMLKKGEIKLWPNHIQLR